MRGRKSIAKAALWASAAAAAFALRPLWLPLADELLQRVTVISTALAMPDGAADAVLAELSLSSEPASSGSGGSSASSRPQHDQQPQSAAESEPEETSSSSSSESGEPPEIPEQYRGSINETRLTGEQAPNFVKHKEAWVRNYTALSSAEITGILAQPPTLTLAGSGTPSLLIYHTHATESYEMYDSKYFDMRETWRDEDNSNNVTAVGDTLAKGLNAGGITTLHDLTQHDNPSYSGAYDRSALTIKSCLAEHPTVSVLLDIHRDAIQHTEDTLEKAVAMVDGRKAAQIMIIAPCDASGKLSIPHWKNNLRLAAGLTDAIERAYPGLTRPVYFIGRAYNYSLSSGALLLEFGTSGNTLDEALYTAELIAPVIVEYLAGVAASGE